MYPVYEYEISKSDEDESNEPKHLVPKMIFRLNKEKEEDPKESKPVQAKAQVVNAALEWHRSGMPRRDRKSVPVLIDAYFPNRIFCSGPWSQKSVPNNLVRSVVLIFLTKYL